MKEWEIEENKKEKSRKGEEKRRGTRRTSFPFFSFYILISFLFSLYYFLSLLLHFNLFFFPFFWSFSFSSPFSTYSYTLSCLSPYFPSHSSIRQRRLPFSNTFAPTVCQESYNIANICFFPQKTHISKTLLLNFIESQKILDLIRPRLEIDTLHGPLCGRAA